MILLSGGFDPVHVGHVSMIHEAKSHGEVHIAVNSDDWLIRKKGFVFMPFEERCAILEEMGCKTHSVDDSDNTVCEAIERLKPEKFGNGGDRGYTNTPEMETCLRLGIELVFNLGGGKIQSSSALTKNYVEERVWGKFEILHESDFKVKILTLKPHHGISIQSHENRNEHWVFPHNNDYTYIKQGEKHCLHNPTDKELRVVEVQTGSYLGEDDERKYFY